MPNPADPRTFAFRFPLSGMLFFQIHDSCPVLLHFCSRVSFSLNPSLTTVFKLSNLCLGLSPLNLLHSPPPEAAVCFVCPWSPSPTVNAHIDQEHPWAQSNSSINTHHGKPVAAGTRLPVPTSLLSLTHISSCQLCSLLCDTVTWSMVLEGRHPWLGGGRPLSPVKVHGWEGAQGSQMSVGVSTEPAH